MTCNRITEANKNPHRIKLNVKPKIVGEYKKAQRAFFFIALPKELSTTKHPFTRTPIVLKEILCVWYSQIRLNDTRFVHWIGTVCAQLRFPFPKKIKSTFSPFDCGSTVNLELSKIEIKTESKLIFSKTKNYIPNEKFKRIDCVCVFRFDFFFFIAN